MDSTRFDRLVRMVGTLSTRRSALGLLATVGVGSALPDDADARRRKNKKKKCRNCGPCRKCQRGKCKSRPDGGACGACATCLAGQCAVGCPDGQTCQGNTCVCPPGQKACQGGCIDDSECCGGCPEEEVCCTNVGECKDVRNDADFCGQCANGQCPGGAICANGECGLTCNTVGQACFGDTCFCGNRVDPNHAGQKVCAEISPLTCDNVPTCDDDADCAPATLGFREVCVSGLCDGKNVCADPCA